VSEAAFLSDTQTDVMNTMVVEFQLFTENATFVSTKNILSL